MLPALDVDVVVAVSLSRGEPVWQERLADPDRPAGETLAQLHLRTASETADDIDEAGARLVMVKALLGTNGYRRNGADPLDCLARASRLGDCAVIAPLEKPFTDGILDAIAAAAPDRRGRGPQPGAVPGRPDLPPGHRRHRRLEGPRPRHRHLPRRAARRTVGATDGYRPPRVSSQGVPESPVVGEDRAKSSTREPSMPNRFSVLLAACVTATPLFLTAAPPAVAAKTAAPTGITLTRWTSDADFQVGVA